MSDGLAYVKGVPADTLRAVSEAATALEQLSSSLAAMASTSGPTCVRHQSRAEDAAERLTTAVAVINRSINRRHKTGRA